LSDSDFFEKPLLFFYWDVEIRDIMLLVAAENMNAAANQCVFSNRTFPNITLSADIYTTPREKTVKKPISVSSLVSVKTSL